MKKIVLKYGLISGLIVSLFMMIGMLICHKNPDFEGSMILGYASMLVAFSFIFIGIRTQRNQYGNGSITFGKAFTTGLYIALISSTLYVLTWLVVYYCFMPDFMDKYVAHALEQAAKKGASPAELEKMTAEMASYKDMYRSPVGVILLTYMEILPLGLLVTLISALILKKKPKPAGS